MKLIERLRNLSMAKTAALVAAGMTVIALFPMSHGFAELMHHRWLDKFQPIEAAILDTRIDDVELRGSFGLAPRVRYRFFVDGKDYDGELIRWHDRLPAGGPPDSDSAPPVEVVVWSRAPASRQMLATLLRKYPVGARTTAFYDPSDPSNSALVYEPFVASRHGTGFWAGLVFVGLAWSFAGVGWLVERSRR